jgi:predicted LPLAT superfamily acyltransferase
LDSFIGLRHPERVGTFHIIGDDVLADYVKAGAGGVLIVSHHGNAELCRTTLSAQFGQVVNVLLHTKQAVRYNELLKSIRPDFLAHTIQVSEIGPNTAVDLMARVERGEWIAIAGDRPPLTGVERTSWVPFLGDPAPFSQGPYVLASLLGCPVFLLFCVRTGEGHTVHVEHFADKIDLPRRQKEPALAELAARYARRLEHHCLSAPDQWYNFFDFWGSPTRQDNQGNDVG